MDEKNKENQPAKLKLNTSYGKLYFLVSLGVIVAVVAMIIIAVVNKNMVPVYVIGGLGIAFCILLFTCEVIRTRNRKAQEEEPVAEPVIQAAPVVQPVIVEAEEVVSKASILNFLATTYGDQVHCNHRPNYTNPGKGQEVGLPLADTHYVVKEKKKQCFLYVYEYADQSVKVLLKTKPDHFAEIRAAHKSAYESNFPKVSHGDIYYGLPIDDSYTAAQVYEIIAKAIEIFDLARPIIQEKVDVNKRTIFDYLAKTYDNKLVSKHRPNYTKPGKGQEVGLPLADTYFILKQKQKICFLYVYEDNDKNVKLLLKTKPEHFEEIHHTFKNSSVSRFPKVTQGNVYYEILLTKENSLSEITSVLDKAISNL